MASPGSTGQGGDGGLVGAGLLRSIIGHLKGQPVLLYGIAGGLLLLAAAGLAAGQPLVVVLVVVVLLAGLAAWLVDARAARGPRFAPEVTAGDDFRAGDAADVASGRMTSGVFAPKVKLGDRAKFGDGAAIASTRNSAGEPVAASEDPPAPASSG